MKITVSGVRPPHVEKLVDAGWKPDGEQRLGMLPIEDARRLSGYDMIGDFTSIGDAVRSFEAATGIDVMNSKDAVGAECHYFRQEGCQPYAGWDLGRFMFFKWDSTPRKVLEAWNA